MPVLTKITESIRLGLDYLGRNCRPITGFQTDCIGSSRTLMGSKYFPETIFLNLLALDLLEKHLSPQTKVLLRKSLCPEDSAPSSQFFPDGPSGKPSFTGTLNFNKYNQIIPDDTDDTGLYHYIALRDGLLDKGDRRLQDVARLIYLNVAENGVIRLYYPPMDKPRENIIDEGSLANAVRFLYFFQVDADLFQKSEDHLYDWLVSGKYLGGTRYYPSPEVFLYFCAEAVSKCPRALGRLQEPLLMELRARADHIIGLNDNERLPLDLSACLLALCCLKDVGSPVHLDVAENLCEILLAMQIKADVGKKGHGGWPMDSLYRLGRTPTFLGGSDVATIFGVAALVKCQEVFTDSVVRVEGGSARCNA